MSTEETDNLDLMTNEQLSHKANDDSCLDSDKKQHKPCISVSTTRCNANNEVCQVKFESNNNIVENENEHLIGGQNCENGNKDINNHITNETEVKDIDDFELGQANTENILQIPSTETEVAGTSAAVSNEMNTAMYGEDTSKPSCSRVLRSRRDMPKISYREPLDMNVYERDDDTTLYSTSPQKKRKLKGVHKRRSQRTEIDSDWKDSEDEESSSDNGDDLLQPKLETSFGGEFVHGHYVREDGKLRLKPGTQSEWMTKVEWAKWQFQEASRRNQLRRNNQIEDGSLKTANQNKASMDLKNPDFNKMTPHQIECYQSKVHEKKHNDRIEWIEKEVLLFKTTKTLLKNLRDSDEDSIKTCVELLKKLRPMAIPTKMLMKNPSILEVINEVRQHTNQEIREVASQVYNKLRSMFAVTWGKPFMEEFFNQSESYRQKLIDNGNLMMDDFGKDDEHIPARYLRGETELDVLWNIGVYRRKQQDSAEPGDDKDQEHNGKNEDKDEEDSECTSDYVLDESDDDEEDEEDYDDNEVIDSDFLKTDDDDDEGDIGGGAEGEGRMNSNQTNGFHENNHYPGGRYDENRPDKGSGKGGSQKPEEAMEVKSGDNDTESSYSIFKKALDTEEISPDSRPRTIKRISIDVPRDRNKKRRKRRKQSKSEEDVKLPPPAFEQPHTKEQVNQCMHALQLISSLNFDRASLLANPGVVENVLKACKSKNKQIKVVGLEIYKRFERVIEDKSQEPEVDCTSSKFKNKSKTVTKRQKMTSFGNNKRSSFSELDDNSVLFHIDGIDIVDVTETSPVANDNSNSTINPGFWDDSPVKGHLTQAQNQEAGVTTQTKLLCDKPINVTITVIDDEDDFVALEHVDEGQHFDLDTNEQQEPVVSANEHDNSHVVDLEITSVVFNNQEEIEEKVDGIRKSLRIKNRIKAAETTLIDKKPLGTEQNQIQIDDSKPSDIDTVLNNETKPSVTDPMSNTRTESTPLHAVVNVRCETEDVGTLDKSSDDDDRESDTERSENTTITDKDCNYQVGDLVWAKYGSYPYWPAMICLDPRELRFYRSFGVKLVKQIHVQYFEHESPTRSWVNEKLVHSFKRNWLRQCQRGGKYFSEGTNVKACAQTASDILKLPLKERIKVVLFNYKSEDEMDITESKFEIEKDIPDVLHVVEGNEITDSMAEEETDTVNMHVDLPAVKDEPVEPPTVKQEPELITPTKMRLRKKSNLKETTPLKRSTGKKNTDCIMIESKQDDKQTATIHTKLRPKNELTKECTTEDQTTKIPQSDEKEIKSEIDSDYDVGDLVWAKLGSYAWWPSMVCLDPHTLTCYKIEKKQAFVHVQFFEEIPTRAWVKHSKIRLCRESFAKDFHKGSMFYTHNRFIPKAVKAADIALQLTLEARIQRVICRDFNMDIEILSAKNSRSSSNLQGKNTNLLKEDTSGTLVRKSQRKNTKQTPIDFKHEALNSSPDKCSTEYERMVIGKLSVKKEKLQQQSQKNSRLNKRCFNLLEDASTFVGSFLEDSLEHSTQAMGRRKKSLSTAKTLKDAAKKLDAKLRNDPAKNLKEEQKETISRNPKTKLKKSNNTIVENLPFTTVDSKQTGDSASGQGSIDACRRTRSGKSADISLNKKTMEEIVDKSDSSETADLSPTYIDSTLTNGNTTGLVDSGVIKRKRRSKSLSKKKNEIYIDEVHIERQWKPCDNFLESKTDVEPQNTYDCPMREEQRSSPKNLSFIVAEQTVAKNRIENRVYTRTRRKSSDTAIKKINKGILNKEDNSGMTALSLTTVDSTLTDDSFRVSPETATVNKESVRALNGQPKLTPRKQKKLTIKTPKNKDISSGPTQRVLRKRTK